MCVWGGRERGKGREERQEGRGERRERNTEIRSKFSGTIRCLQSEDNGQEVDSLSSMCTLDSKLRSAIRQGGKCLHLLSHLASPGFNIFNSFLNSSERCSFPFPGFFTTPFGSVTQVHREDMFGPQLLGSLTLISCWLLLNLPLDSCNIYKYKACLIYQVSLFL